MPAGRRGAAWRCSAGLRQWLPPGPRSLPRQRRPRERRPGGRSAFAAPCHAGACPSSGHPGAAGASTPTETTATDAGGPAGVRVRAAEGRDDMQQRRPSGRGGRTRKHLARHCTGHSLRSQFQGSGGSARAHADGKVRGRGATPLAAAPSPVPWVIRAGATPGIRRGAGCSAAARAASGPPGRSGSGAAAGRASRGSGP